jgi:bifunctional oligoribonuclease and PAP phosphatase NrnA
VFGSSDLVIAWLRGLAGKTVYVVTHEAPDGDAIGSLLGAAELLSAFGASPVMLCADAVPKVYRFLGRSDEIMQEVPAATGGEPPAAHLYVDCGDRSRPGRLASVLNPDTYTVNIDHHTSNDSFGDLNWVLPEASSTGEMLAKLFLLTKTPLLGARDALYTAIATDTGSFAFESTAPSTHEVAAALLRAGTRPGHLQDLIYNSREPAALALLGAALSSLQVRAGGRIAYMVLGPEDFARVDAGQQHTDGIVNYARSLAGVEAGLLFYSIAPGRVKVGIRTRPGVSADRIATAFGGGGHPRAAGCQLEAPIDKAVSLVIAEAERQLGD